jgi:hypothetical protein
MKIRMAKNVPGREERAREAVRDLAAEGRAFDGSDVRARMLWNDLTMSDRALNGIIRGAVAGGLLVEIGGGMWRGRPEQEQDGGQFNPSESHNTYGGSQ